MIAVLWLFLAFFLGWRISAALIGDPASLLMAGGSSESGARIIASPWPSFLFRLVTSLWLGLLPATWLTYAAAAAAHALWPKGPHPLILADLVLMSAGTVWLGISLYRRHGFSAGQSGAIRLQRSLQRPGEPLFPAVLMFWLAFAVMLMTGTFFRLGSQIHAGYSVFSDFAPHTALVSSFASGRNWPTEYPHFAHDGIAYHFMFFFLCGNLNFLGLPLDLAINLPSILALASFSILLGLLAYRLTGKKGTFLLAPLLTFCRSSLAFFTHIADVLRQNAGMPDRLRLTISELWGQSQFIGNTLHDDWGLWGINVYANQRHLLSGLSLVLIVIFLFLPDLQAGLVRSGRWKTWFRRQSWIIADKSGRRRVLAASLIGLMMPYWHGSALVSLLLILLPVAVFSYRRLGFVVMAAGSVLSALLQSWLFTGKATRVVSPAWMFGFLAPERSLPGAAGYILEVTGIALPLLLIAFWLSGWRRKIMLAGFTLPLVFAFTVSLTPDVTVNHKYVMVTLAMGNIYLADLLIRLWHGTRGHTDMTGQMGTDRVLRYGSGLDMRRRSGRMIRGLPHNLTRSLALLLASVLMITGLYEWRIVRNINQNTVSMDLASPLTAWIRQNTEPDAVFVTAPYHYHAFFLSGRKIWFGHSYYAWSAGHDTQTRFSQYSALLAADPADPAALADLARQEGLDYLIIDDVLRQALDLWVNEAFFDASFSLVAVLPQTGNTKIYDLRQPVIP